MISPAIYNRRYCLWEEIVRSLDLNAIEKRTDYSELPKSYVIFICKFDLYQCRHCIYTFEERCLEEPTLSLGDETRKIFVNPYGKWEHLNRDLQAFLLYMSKGIATDTFTKELEEEVIKVKNNAEWRVEDIADIADCTVEKVLQIQNRIC